MRDEEWQGRISILASSDRRQQRVPLLYTNAYLLGVPCGVRLQCPSRGYHHTWRRNTEARRLRWKASITE